MNEQERPYHEVSMIFPLLEGIDFEQFKADIAENGLLEAIWLHPDGSIIDGRNRHRACLELGIQPRFRTWDGQGSLVSFVVSLNLHRRHLTSSQRAVIALDVLPMLEAEARERQLATLKQGDTLPDPQLFADRDQGEARQQAASLFQTNRQYVSDAKRIQREAPDLLEQVKAGEISIPKAKEQLKDKMAVHFSSETPEHYTPQIIIEAVLACLGQIDLDPCSNSHDDPNVPAVQHFIQEDDGLVKMWHGKVYMNPPYGREIDKWVEKLCTEHEAGRTVEAIALVPSRTDTQWWRRLRDYPVCFIEGRLSFGDSGNSAPFPSAVFYLGEELGNFYQAFYGLGDCWQRMIRGVSFAE